MLRETWAKARQELSLVETEVSKETAAAAKEVASAERSETAGKTKLEMDKVDAMMAQMKKVAAAADAGLAKVRGGRPCARRKGAEPRRRRTPAEHLLRARCGAGGAAAARGFAIRC